MNDLRRHIRELTLMFGLLLGVISGGADAPAQTPAGTSIWNDAVGTFAYKTGAMDSVRSNSAEIVVSPAIASLDVNLVPSRTVVRTNEIVMFTLHFRNSGNGSAYGPIAIDSLPSQVVFVYASRGGQFVGNRVLWNSLGTIAPGTEDSVVVSARVRGDLVEPDSVILVRARMWASNAPLVTDSAQVIVQFDEKPGNPLLQAAKAVDLAMARPGMTLTYAIEVSNTGEGPATGLTVVDTLPPHTSLVSATNGAALQGNVLLWSPDTLWVNGIFSAAIAVRINQDCPSGVLENLAVVRSTNAAVLTAGPAQTLVSAALAQTVSLRAVPEAAIGNGTDSVRVIAEVRDASGNLVGNGVPVRFTASRGHFANGVDTMVGFTTAGVVQMLLTSEVVNQEVVYSTITASTIGSNGLSLNQSINILFYPAAIKGIVLSAATGGPVSGVIIRVLDQSQQEIARDTTGADGQYLVPLISSGEYVCVATYTSVFGDAIDVSQRVSVQVPLSGGNPAVTTLGGIAGVLVNRSSGQPIREEHVEVGVDQTDPTKTSSGRSTPLTVNTDSRGIFVIDSLGLGVYELRVQTGLYSGSLVVPDTIAGAFIVDANIGLADIPGFEIVKNVNKRIAEIGDAVAYTLDLRNTGSMVSITNLRIVDHLPTAFVFAENSSSLDGRILPNPNGRRVLEWTLPDTLKPGETIRLSYMVTLGADALQSEGINRAYATGRSLSGDTVSTAVASVPVTVRPGVFTDRGIVIGKVFYDTNGNGRQDEHEKGISGVELWMEDGTRIVTGDEGKYSLPEVIPGQHVIRINRPTVPTGSTILAPHSDFAGEGISRFIRLTEGGIARADFFLQEPHQASLQFAMVRTPFELDAPGVLAQYIVRWNEVGKATCVTLRDTLPEPWSFDLRGITVNRSPASVGDERSRILQLPLQAKNAGSVDTIWAVVAVDSATTMMRVVPTGKAVFSYAKSREAVIPATLSRGSLTGITTEMTGSAANVVAALLRLSGGPAAAPRPDSVTAAKPGVAHTADTVVARPPQPAVVVPSLSPMAQRVDSDMGKAPIVAGKQKVAPKPVPPVIEKPTPPAVVKKAQRPVQIDSIAQWQAAALSRKSAQLEERTQQRHATPVRKPAPVDTVAAPHMQTDNNFRKLDELPPQDGGASWMAHELIILALAGYGVYRLLRRKRAQQTENPDA